MLNTLSRVRWLPVLCIALNAAGILLVTFNPERLGTAFIIVFSAFSLAILEVVRFVESNRAGTRNATPDQARRGR